MQEGACTIEWKPLKAAQHSKQITCESIGWYAEVEEWLQEVGWWKRYFEWWIVEEDGTKWQANGIACSSAI